MWRTGLSALLSHWRRHPIQLSMLLMGLALGTALWSGIQAINSEARASYDRAAALMGQDRFDRIGATDGRPVDQAVFVALRRAGWLVSPVVEGRMPGTDLRILGIEPLTLPRGAAGPDLVSGTDIQSFTTGSGVMFVSTDTAETLIPEGLPPLRTDPSIPPGTGLVDIGIAQGLLGLDGRLTHLLLAPESPRPGPLPAGLQIVKPSANNDIARLTDSFHLNLTAFGFLAFTVGLFIVHSSIGLAFEQRRPVFRTLRALGLPARNLTMLLLAELLLLALVAGVVGIALGYLVAAALLPDVAATLRGLYGADVPGTLGLRPGWWAAGLGVAVAGTLVASAQSLWQLARLPLLAPAQPRAWARASARTAQRQGLAAICLLAASGLLLTFGGGLVAGFAGLGALLLGAALLLPLALAAATDLGRRAARGPLSEWFWADTRQQLPGLSLALMALLLALATNIGVGTMVSSFRLTFTGWLDQRLASELYVTASTEEEATRLVAWLAPRADAVLPIWSVEAPILGRPGDIYGVADHPTYRDNWPLLAALPDAWDLVAEGRGVMVNEQLFRAGALDLGAPLALPGGALTIAGVYSDYGNPRPQVLISPDTLTAWFPDVPRLRFGIRIVPERAEALQDALISDFGLQPGSIIDQAGIKRLSLDIFERTFTVTAALNVLTLGVAGLAIFASLLTLSGMRLPQVAPLWAMGMTRRRLAALDLLRTLVLATLTFVLALPLGLALAWVLLAVINVQAFGWRLPLHVFPADWLHLGGLAVVAAGLASAVPALRLARLAPADLVKVFSNER